MIPSLFKNKNQKVSPRGDHFLQTDERIDSRVTYGLGRIREWNGQ
jgi:hypothetical protein